VLAVVCLLVVAALPAGSSTAGATGATTLRVLQMNLCNSGRAGCYTGRAVPEAVEVIAAETPDVVTVNEICRDDLPVLERALAAAHPRGTVRSAFQAAGDRPSRSVTRCRNGQPFGIGLLARLDTRDARPDVRAWLCLRVGDALHACTTHLANTSGTVALAQCAHLLGTVMPELRRGAGATSAVLGGDLNLSRGGAPDVRSCVPPDHVRVDDGARQQIVATHGLTICCHRAVGMRGSTDHPALLAVLTVGGVPVGGSVAP
jgi:hypothetical protein